ncbi:MAG: hypothetical protein JW772_05690 [Candidatus Diapherotrites archaeon]|nr:hypothetical protein [Candidatus Diapherotrites archaeon]
MGLFDSFKKKKEGQKKAEEAAKPQGKYDQPCALCGESGTEKKWMGQYWHKKCMRAAKKGAKKMI